MLCWVCFPGLKPWAVLFSPFGRLDRTRSSKLGMCLYPQDVINPYRSPGYVSAEV